ncbi:sensor histidine kinase [Panacibacter sp. DH6]|uniref:Oxygen sensor histidine kinase NreB n=1 Tax=Panacibacter microcysteis TaxID=2793269 RepID=A0A931E8N1_9BACT|nr:ATP-binding protein [Panacibacter microcysteis]MBG9377179.1 sensor histidine kinase [Panacibacter microcysteis]
MQKLYAEQLLQSQLEIQEQTLQHISKELHDNLGQVASLIKINLYTIGLDEKDKAAQKLDDTRELTKQLITDLKALSVSLGADRIAQTGLAKALETEIDRLNKTGQFKATFEQQGILPNVHNDTAIILYRMAQEVLNNMVKHSNAQHITFKLSFIDNLIILAISDDGNGFDIDEQMKNGNGAGLHNLQKRATLINATLTMQSIIGQGTQVTIELPYSYDPNYNTKTETGPG